MVSKLEDLCVIKVLAGLCCRPDVKNIIYEELIRQRKRKLIFYEKFPLSYPYSESFGKLNQILKKKISSDVKKLPLPVRNFLPQHLVFFIALEMLQWVRYHSEHFALLPFYCINFIKSSFFTSMGELDKTKAAKELVKDESLHVTLQFQIAIEYFLEEDICLTWAKMIKSKSVESEEKNILFWLKNNFPHKNILDLVNKKPMENNEDSENVEGICEHFLTHGNEVAFKNIWKMVKISNKEKILQDFVNLMMYPHQMSFEDMRTDEAFKGLVMKRSYIEIFRFLLNDDDNLEKLKKILLRQDAILLFLKWLLLWPNQDLFLKMLNLLFEKLSRVSFYNLLQSIVDMIGDEYFCKTYNYRYLFKELWVKAPSHYRIFILSAAHCNLYEFTEDEESEYCEYYLLENFYSSMPSTHLVGKFFYLEPFTEEDLFIVKMLVNDNSFCGKSIIVERHGDDICAAALISRRERLADLFIECFVEKKLANKFKRNFVYRKYLYILDELESLGRHDYINDLNAWARKM